MSQTLVSGPGFAIDSFGNIGMANITANHCHLQTLTLQVYTQAVPPQPVPAGQMILCMMLGNIVLYVSNGTAWLELCST